MMFRTQDNVPEYYVNESRDFQLLCRLKDIVIGGLKYNIDSLNHTSNTIEINATLLPLLKSKVGFFDYEELTEDQLRYLLAGFPNLIKYKGSNTAIEKAIHLWFRVHSFEGKLVNIGIDNDNYIITLYISSTKADTKLLDALFQYILPTGYIVNYVFGKENRFRSDFVLDDSYAYVNMHNKVNSRVRVLKEDTVTERETLPKRVLGTVGFTQVIRRREINATANGTDLSPDTIKTGSSQEIDNG